MDVKAAILHYCNYQERCHKEVINKLYELGCTTPEVGQYLTDVIEAGILNEERYAQAFVRGKFRMKQWGRQKIVQHLKLNKISEYCIKKGLKEIDPEEYERILIKLTEKKLKELKSEKNIWIKRAKLYKHLLQKGYEQDLVQEQLHKYLDKAK